MHILYTTAAMCKYNLLSIIVQLSDKCNVRMYWSGGLKHTNIYYRILLCPNIYYRDENQIFVRIMSLVFYHLFLLFLVFI